MNLVGQGGMEVLKGNIGVVVEEKKDIVVSRDCNDDSHSNVSTMGLHRVRTHNKLGFASRGMALCIVLAVLLGTLVGSMAPEFGTILASNIGMVAHVFNTVFFIVGIVGVVLALFVGRGSRGE